MNVQNLDLDRKKKITIFSSKIIFCVCRLPRLHIALVLEENNMKVVIKVINLKRAPLPPIETVLYFVLQVLGDYMLVVLQWPF